MQDRRDLQAELQRLDEARRSHDADAVLSTRVAHSDERAIIVHAGIVTGAGPAGSGLGSATPEDGAAEQAENRAVLRAMIVLGVPIPADEPARLTGPTAVDPPGRVVQFPTHEPEPHDEEEPAPPPRTARPDPPARSTRAEPPATQSPARSAPAPATTPPSRTAPTPAAAPAPVASPSATGAPAARAGAGDDPDPADLSWNGFWKWARDRGFSNRMALEEALKQPLGSRPPGEVRQLMREQLGIDG